MKGNGDGKIETGVVPIADDRVMFRSGITFTTEMRYVPTATNEIPLRPQALRSSEHQRGVRLAC